MRRGHHRDVVASDVDAYFQAVLVDVGEVMLGLFGVFMCDIEVNVVLAPLLHLAVDGACHHVARSQRQARVVFLHKLLAGQIA